MERATDGHQLDFFTSLGGNPGTTSGGNRSDGFSEYLDARRDGCARNFARMNRGSHSGSLHRREDGMADQFRDLRDDGVA